MTFKLSNWFTCLLTNHVEIEWNMQTFMEWVLNSKLYTKKILILIYHIIIKYVSIYSIRKKI